MPATIIFVHGAFAESASWDRVIDPLLSAGDPVIAAANPLRGLAHDAAAVSDLVRSAGKSCLTLTANFPGSTLKDTLQARMAATQRPVTQEALSEPSGARPLWKERPAWFLIGEQDHNIPAALQHYMAKRARARRTIQIPGASHAVAVAHPEATAHMILEAAR